MKKRTANRQQQIAKSQKLKAKSEQQTANSQQQIAQSQQQIAVMLELLRSAVLDRDPVLDPNVNVDWDDLMERASKQGILAWVYDGICRLPKEQQPPRQQRINWALSAQEIWDRYYKQKDVLADMVRVCDENDMRMLLLKGIGLAELYPKPESRPSGDIDVCFFDDFEKGNELFAEGEHEFNNKHEGFDYKGVHVENHLKILDTDTPERIAIYNYIEPYIKHSEITHDGYYRLPVIAEILYLLTHLYRHYTPTTPVPLRSFIDVVLYLNCHKEEISINELQKGLRTCKLDHLFDIIVLLSSRLLDINLNEFYTHSVGEDFIDKLWQQMVSGKDSLFCLFECSGTLRFLSKQYRINRKLSYYLGWRRVGYDVAIIRALAVPKLKHFLGIPTNVVLVEGLESKLNMAKTLGRER